MNHIYMCAYVFTMFSTSLLPSECTTCEGY